MTCILLCEQGRGVYNMSHGIGKKQWPSVALLLAQCFDMGAVLWKDFAVRRLWACDVFFSCTNNDIKVPSVGTFQVLLSLVFVGTWCLRTDAELTATMVNYRQRCSVFSINLWYTRISLSGDHGVFYVWSVCKLVHAHFKLKPCWARFSLAWAGGHVGPAPVIA